MRSKKNILVFLSVFIAIVFIFSLFGQQQQRGALLNEINDLKSHVAVLETTVSTIQNDIINHTHDYSELTGTAPFSPISHNHNSLYSTLGHNHDVNYAALIHPHDYASLTGNLPSHAHDYSDISNPPSISSESEIIGLINKNALGAPDYDSWWMQIDKGRSLTIEHNLGGDIGDYLVDLQFWRDELGPHNIWYGEIWMDTGTRPIQRGASWYDLTDKTIKVARASDDTLVDLVRVRIWKYNW